MIETEAKIRLSQEEFQWLYQKLGKPSFSLQRNWGYFLDGGFLRVREEGNKKYVTLKKLNKGEIYNSREELEVQVSDVSVARNIFTALGFEEHYYEKRRATKKIDGLVVCLDEISEAGYFVEVEGEEKGISQVLVIFGLNDSPIERRNYFEIVLGGRISKI
jgi:predicted adenylyl cyclase CyaB